MQSQPVARLARKPNGKHPHVDPVLNPSKRLHALQSARWDFSVRLASDKTALAGKIAHTFNEIVSADQRLARELECVGQIVGKDGRKTKVRALSAKQGAAFGRNAGPIAGRSGQLRHLEYR